MLQILKKFPLWDLLRVSVQGDSVFLSHFPLLFSMWECNYIVFPSQLQHTNTRCTICNGGGGEPRACAINWAPLLEVPSCLTVETAFWSMGRRLREGLSSSSPNGAIVGKDSIPFLFLAAVYYLVGLGITQAFACWELSTSFLLASSAIMCITSSFLAFSFLALFFASTDLIASV